jgi:hypothetical protein
MITVLHETTYLQRKEEGDVKRLGAEPAARCETEEPADGLAEAGLSEERKWLSGKDILIS